MMQTPPQLTYRRATMADIDALLKLGIAAYHVCKDDMPLPGWEELKSKLKDMDLLKETMCISTVFVCEHEGRLIGKAFLVPQGNPTAIYPADWAYIRKVGVHPEYTDYGIGTRLTQLCIDEALAQGARTIGLHTSEIMRAARHIYEGLCFKVQREIPAQFGVRYFLYALQLSC